MCDCVSVCFLMYAITFWVPSNYAPKDSFSINIRVDQKFHFSLFSIVFFRSEEKLSKTENVVENDIFNDKKNLKL